MEEKDKNSKETNQEPRAQEALYINLELVSILNILSTNFINMPLDEIDDGIAAGIATVGEFVGFDRSYIFRYSSAAKLVKASEWWQEGVDSKVLKNLPVSSLPCLMDNLNRLEVIYIPSVASLGPKRELEKKEFTQQHIKTFLAIPLIYNAKLIGFLGFDSLNKENKISEEILIHLKMAATVFESAFGRKKSIIDLSVEKEQLSVTLRSIGDAVISTDIEGKILIFNRTAEKLSGFSVQEVIGKEFNSVIKLLEPKTRLPQIKVASEVINSRQAIEALKEVILVAKDSTERLVVARSVPLKDFESRAIGAVTVFRDVTCERKMEQEITRAQKLESVGILAGGIAHDFNNILTAILSNITLARMRPGIDPETKEILEDAEMASIQARKLTQQLLTFAKGGVLVKKTASLSDLLKETTDFVLRGSKGRCVLDVAEDLWVADIDSDQISMVIQNIVINADQAMPQGGIINVKASNITAKGDEGLGAKSTRYVQLDFKDQGIGIPLEYLSKIFDPYFSTKQRGSGLGLATAYSIVKKHEGFIKVDSKPGEGTVVSIYLPASQEIKIVAKDEERMIITGIGRILVMDDEEIVRKAIGRAITALGYMVDFAIDGKEAIALYKKAKESGQDYEAVILDLTVPGGMGGKETIERLLQFDPEIKAIASSGYSTDPIISEPAKYGFSGVAIKPYNIEELSNILYRVIKGNK